MIHGEAENLAELDTARSAPRSIGDVALEVLTRAPEWLRHDLSSKDQQARARAEETLAAMISAAWEENMTDDSIAA
jgi:hypothetical protein